MDFRRFASTAIVLLFLSLAIPARAAGFGDYVARPLHAIGLAIETAFTQLVAVIGPHHVVPVQITSAPWHAPSLSASAAVFNAAVASLEPQIQTPSPPRPLQALADAANANSETHSGFGKSGTGQPQVSNQLPPVLAASVLSAAPTTTYITQDELTTQLQIATNNLRSLIYSNTNSGSASQVAQGQYASGNYTNEIALSNRIDQLTGTTLDNVIVNGISGITAGNLPAIDLTSKVTGVLPIGSGGIGTSTAPSQNKLLIADANGNWEYAATSSLGIAGGGGGTFNAIGPSNQTQTGPTVTLATSTNTANGLTSALTITGSGNTINFSPSLTGVLTVPGGGTGWASISAGSIPFGNGSSPLATSSSLDWDNINSRLGIGTSTPGSLLSLNNIANFTTATSTFYGNGLNLTAGCFAVNGTCVASPSDETVDASAYAGANWMAKVNAAAIALGAGGGNRHSGLNCRRRCGNDGRNSKQCDP